MKFFYKQLHLSKYENKKGRKLALPITETLALAIFKQSTGIVTQKTLWKIFEPLCSYKTLVVNLNRFAMLTLAIPVSLLKWNRINAHLVKHTDSTDIPVCLNKNAKYHKTMKGLAEWGHNGKDSFYGLKPHLTTDLKPKNLSIRFTVGNVSDVTVFAKLNQDLMGIFVADATYISHQPEKDFRLEGQRIILAKPRKNMKKIMTKFQEMLYGNRMLIELNFRNLKMFYGLITSLPRSINGYLANYIYSLLVYRLA